MKNTTFASQFVDRVVHLVKSRWDDDADGLTKWNVVRDGLLDASTTMLGLSKRYQPDWFVEAENVLRPLIDRRNNLFSLWLRSSNHRDRQKYLTQRRLVVRKVWECKNRWYQEKARSIQAALSQNRPSAVWQDIHAICKSRAGLQPVKSRAVKKQDGSFCSGSVETLGRCQGHFEGVLNVESSFNLATIDSIPSMVVRREMCNPPTGDEVLAALSRIKVGKAAGSNGLLPDIVKCCGGPLLDFIVSMFGAVWREKQVPAELRDALLVPVPKKGDLSVCDNWRGISLLDVMGKLFARVLNDRLQAVVEDSVADSQCGFRAGRGCVDMVFCVRQLVEKTIEHHSKIFLLFVDLHKAYDSVPREALWCALRKYGVPDCLVDLVRSFHDGMVASVVVGGEQAPSFQVRNGLRQGCTIAPTLFTLYFELVIRCWLSHCDTAGIEVLYKIGGKLVGERIRRSSSFVISECLFADDAALICSSRADMAVAARIFEEVVAEFGLTLSILKTKLLVAGVHLATGGLASLELGGGSVEVVKEFKYLGSLIEAHGRMTGEVTRRSAQASRVFGELRSSVFTACDLSLETKRLVYQSVVLGVLLYGVETWAPTQVLVRKLETFHRRCVRCIIGIGRAVQWEKRITTTQLAERFDMRESIGNLLTLARLRWLGKVRQDFKSLSINDSLWYQQAQDRSLWKQLCNAGMENLLTVPQSHHSFHCPTCQRSFRRSQDIARHKCVTTCPRRGCH